jgi:hypothetical protein
VLLKLLIHERPDKSSQVLRHDLLKRSWPFVGCAFEELGVVRLLLNEAHLNGYKGEPGPHLVFVG